ncbi:hypothetical protein SAMN05216382_2265 [Sphingomonas palmae]|uniref:Uncharacterized protein n=1 Tax=Sphingomonas palmae TaxID=1855283 RepID=A0A1H7RJ04_9SPHN|nr:hypothetical protein SAMN05216382_2265 [Sphingomonas palmae]
MPASPDNGAAALLTTSEGLSFGSDLRVAPVCDAGCSKA